MSLSPDFKTYGHTPFDPHGTQLRASDSSVLNRPSTPYHCPRCLDTGEFFGVLVFEGDEVPNCPNHEEVVVALARRDVLRSRLKVVRFGA